MVFTESFYQDNQEPSLVFGTLHGGLFRIIAIISKLMGLAKLPINDSLIRNQVRSM